jgi:hypothetical protein
MTAARRSRSTCRSPPCRRPRPVSESGRLAISTAVLARRPIRALALLGATVALVAATGCGGGGGKPSYCSDRDQLESSIEDLANLSFSDGLSGLESRLTTIRRDATTLVDSAKSDFPSETSAIRSSVDALAGDVRALPSSPSASQIAALASDASSVVSSVRAFADATDSNCG